MGGMRFAKDDPEALAWYLLGADWSGPGLLRRVGEKVRELTDGYLPRYKTGSVMGFTDLKHESESIDDSPVMDLAVALIEWKGKGASGRDSRPTLVKYLLRNQISDAELLVGSEKTGKGLLYEIRTEAKTVLAGAASGDTERNLREDINRYLTLAQMLREWLDSECVHEPKQLPTDDPKVVVLECAKCGSRLSDREFATA